MPLFGNKKISELEKRIAELEAQLVRGKVYAQERFALIEECKQLETAIEGRDEHIAELEAENSDYKAELLQYARLAHEAIQDERQLDAKDAEIERLGRCVTWADCDCDDCGARMEVDRNKVLGICPKCGYVLASG